MKPLTGLSSKEVGQKLKTYGFNSLERKKQLPWFKLLLDQFRSPLIYILFFAGATTLVLKEWTDAVVIFLAVGVNTVLGFIQEFKAEKSLVALKKMLVSHALVIRDGQEEEIEAKDIVPGDIVVLKTGEKVPADGTLIEEADLHVNEAILTGESLPVRKLKIKNEKLKIADQNQVFMGTVVVGGRGKMIVAQTGMKTRMGQIAGTLKETIEEETPLKKQIAKLSKILAILFSLICVVIFFEGLLRERPWLEMFTLSVAVAVAAIPEGLVISLTVILTLGMQRILKRKGLVRRLLAAETLGSVDVICADKTGTLTEGKMRVVGGDVSGGIWEKDQEKRSEKWEAMIKAIALCNNMTNPLEISMMEWVKKLKIKSAKLKVNVDGLNKQYPRLDEIPFSSEKKFIATLHRSDKKGQGIIYLSGAPEMVMQLCYLNAQEKKTWTNKLDGYTKKGFRVVAFASMNGNLKAVTAKFERLKKGLQKFDGHVDGSYGFLQLKWVGLLLFEDPARVEVKPALAACGQAGIRVKVITGDYKNTAAAVLEKVGLIEEKLDKGQVIEGWELEKLDEEELKKKIDQVLLFCRTTPEQKIRIVKALQGKGHIVAMMGDGVNDALALKKADIGVVVGSASEVAKETADMVLLDNNFNTIVAAVEEGRGIFENIKKVVLYLLSDSFTEVILIGGSLLLGLPVPILPAQILWVNLVEDGLPGLALAFEPKDEGLMKEKPRPKNSHIIDKELRVLIFMIGLTTDLLLFGLFLILTKLGFNIGMVRTMIFAGLAIDSLLYVFSCKTLKKNLWHENLWSNKFLVISFLVGALMLLLGIYSPLATFLKTEPLGWLPWVLILGLGSIDVILIELVKWLFLKKRKNTNPGVIAEDARLKRRHITD